MGRRFTYQIGRKSLGAQPDGVSSAPFYLDFDPDTENIWIDSTA